MSLELVKNESKYFDFIRNLRNSPSLQNGFIDRTYITADMQKRYMDKYKDNYYICLMNDNPVGFIGIVNNDLRLAVDKNFHNQGIGSFMLGEILKIDQKFEVKVIRDNAPSLKMFKKMGFSVVGSDVVSGVDIFLLRRVSEE